MTQNEMTYRVTGMTCGGCMQSMKKSLQRVIPGLEISVSLEEDAVVVRGEHELSAIQKAVEDAGFTFQGPVR